MTSPLAHDAPAWRRLQDLAPRTPPLRALFAADPQRFDRYAIEGAGLLVDLSKQRIDDAVQAALLDLARERGLAAACAALLDGGLVNPTEQRAALHTALRLPAGAALPLGGQDAAADAAAVRARIADFAERVRNGTWTGHRGRSIRHVINLGIGGSDLGPQMVTQALSPFASRERLFHFVSNVDGRHLADVLATIDAAGDADRTLVIVASKTFTTLETMMNAHSARDWLLARGVPRDALAQHVVAVSTNVAAARAFGVAEENVFPFWDWVGGRYSVWSAIGLAVVLAIGAAQFEAFLAGAHAMDRHFAETPWERNLPVRMALAGLWNINFLGCDALSIAPYHQRLARLPAYLQQLEMESNGKRVAVDGSALPYASCPVLFGEPGTNGQHAYFQLLHQGTRPVPVDFIAVARDDSGLPGHNEALLANCFAQSQALAFGKTEDEARPETPDRPQLASHRSFPGDRPSSTIVLDALTPDRLGALLALYEHKVFVQGTLWGINPFDQWGVELGKVLAKEITPWLTEGRGKPLDSSTAGLVGVVRRAWGLSGAR